jgi:hypothetical protein
MMFAANMKAHTPLPPVVFFLQHLDGLTITCPPDSSLREQGDEKWETTPPEIPTASPATEQLLRLHKQLLQLHEQLPHLQKAHLATCRAH